MRNFQKIKELKDYEVLDDPEIVNIEGNTPIPNVSSLMILRMLVRAKYGEFKIPHSLQFLAPIIYYLSDYDIMRTGIHDSWCYITIRHGEVKSKTDDEWHFDGSSFRTDIIPERNYIWVNHDPTLFKSGTLIIPNDFDPLKHNLFKFAEYQLQSYPTKTGREKQWYLLSPFCLHRRPTHILYSLRTFYRICFSDIEGRDINNTHNPLLPTPFYGRNPVQSFRNNLIDYYANK